MSIEIVPETIFNLIDNFQMRHMREINKRVNDYLIN